MSRKPKVVVSDHALVRYLERVELIDLDATRADILEALRDRIAPCSLQNVVVDGFRYCIRNGVVTTIEPQGYHPAPMARHFR